mgnify:CR=1 FL=1
MPSAANMSTAITQCVDTSRNTHMCSIHLCPVAVWVPWYPQIRAVFDAAVAAAPSIIFLDEVDVIAPKRESSQRSMDKRIVAQVRPVLQLFALAFGCCTIAPTHTCTRHASAFGLLGLHFNEQR